MTLSIGVLPALLGLRMARISPAAIAKDTSVNALTPPNERETFSTERSNPPPPGGGRSARASGPGGGDSASAFAASPSSAGLPPPHPGLPSAVRPSPFRGGGSKGLTLRPKGEEVSAGPLMRLSRAPPPPLAPSRPES